MLPKRGLAILEFLAVLMVYFLKCHSCAEPPHIIYILADDLGWNDVSFHGSPQIPTPNIDALASSGIVLQSFYMAPQCTPSRASLMTGRYPIHTGLQHFVIIGGQRIGLPLNIKILPQYLKDLGYSTALIGKWHLGYFKKEYTPLYRGFDYFYGFLNGMIDYFDYTYFYKDSNLTFFGVDLYDGGDVVKNQRGVYATELFSNKAISVIKNHNTSQPLFLLMSHLAPHSGNRNAPYQTPPEYVAKYNYIKDTNRRKYAGSVSRLDESVGEIFEALDVKGMLNNSIVIFSSDNGGPTEDIRGGASSNWPLRGQKMQLWEGGVRVPALVWSPLLQLREPRLSKQLMHVSDWLPTLYHAAGGDVKNLGDIDGVSMWPHLLNRTHSTRTEVLLNIDPIAQIAAIRVGDYKLTKGVFAGKEDIWYGPSGTEELSITGSLDNWVWKNGSVVKDILQKNGWWLATADDLWRSNLTVNCGEHSETRSTSCHPDLEPCLYDIARDPCEYENIAESNTKVVHDLSERIRAYEATAMPTAEVRLDPKADPLCHGFAFVPWMDEEHATNCPYIS